MQLEHMMISQTVSCESCFSTISSVQDQRCYQLQRNKHNIAARFP